MQVSARNALFTVALALACQGCWRHHVVVTTDAAAGAGDAGVEDARAERPASPPVERNCADAPLCVLSERTSVALPPGTWIQRDLPESDTFVLGRAGDPPSYEIRSSDGLSRLAMGQVIDAIETPSAIVVLAITPETPQPAIVVFDRESLASRARIDGDGWAGLARDGEGFGALRSMYVGPGDADFLFTWSRFDASGVLVSSDTFVRPRGGWVSQPWASTVRGELVLGWFRDGCAHVLWLRDGVLIGEPVLHCPADPGCAAHVVALTPEREGRVGFVVEVDCPPVPCGGAGEPLCTPPRFLVGVLDGPTPPTRVLDTCATRRPVLALEAGGGMRMIASGVDGLEARWLDRELRVERAVRVPDAWGPIGLRADGAMITQDLGGLTWRARCAP